jgi:hypothetical protein
VNSLNLFKTLLIGSAITFIAGIAYPAISSAAPPQNPQNGQIDVEGQIPTAPPTVGATITTPTNGQSFKTLPVTVAGLCPKGLLVEIFRNNVFAGSVMCDTGSYSLQIDLFIGENQLVARVFDALNQSGPDSNIVNVTFSSGAPGSTSRISLTTPFAKRGADPNTQLVWPVTVSGGAPPYAISVDWGDKTSLDLISQKNAGSMDLKHTYTQAGVYNVTIKGTDANGDAAYLQVVAVANGNIAQNTKGGTGTTTSKTEKVVIIWPIIIVFVFAVSGFWLGERHEIEVIKGRLQKGQRPFK